MPQNRSMEWATIAEYQVGSQFQSYLQFLKAEPKKTAKGDPYFLCSFRDKTGQVEAMAWNNSELYRWCQTWTTGDAIWISGSFTQSNTKYKPNLDIIEAFRIEDDAELSKDFDWSLLIPCSQWTPEELKSRIFEILNSQVKDQRLIELVRIMFEEHWDVLSTLPAASKMHHAIQTGWLEHIWSMARMAAVVGSHYSRYYHDLNPPVQTDILIVAAVLHDVGKALELNYDSRSEATYTTEGRLKGHIVMGRDMIRSAALQLEPPLDSERLLRLEHAILSHHGRQEYGSPVVPQTLEAFLLSEIDDMDAKVNAIVRSLKMAEGADPETSQGEIWSERVYSCDPPRTFYRGTQLEPAYNANHQEDPIVVPQETSEAK